MNGVAQFAFDRRKGLGFRAGIQKDVNEVSGSGKQVAIAVQFNPPNDVVRIQPGPHDACDHRLGRREAIRVEYQRDRFLDEFIDGQIAGLEAGSCVGEQGVDILVDFSLEPDALQ